MRFTFIAIFGLIAAAAALVAAEPSVNITIPPEIQAKYGVKIPTSISVPASFFTSASHTMNTLSPAGPYGDPNPDGCASGLTDAGVTGVSGRWCAAQCWGAGTCPSSPTGTDPLCAFNAGQVFYCGAFCSLSNDLCGGSTGAGSCKDLGWGDIGLCTHP